MRSTGGWRTVDAAGRPERTMGENAYIDCHVHLQEEVYCGTTDEVIARARRAGVRRFICCGTAPEDWQAVLDISARDTEVIPFVGLHPWFLDSAPSGWLATADKILSSSDVIGVGEIGLDRLKASGADLSRQESAMGDQLELASKFNRPVAIHCVRAWDRLTVLLKNWRKPTPFMLHSFAGSVDIVRELAPMGAYFSFSATVLVARKTNLRQTMLAVPPDRLLLESDAPAMLPAPELRVAEIPDAWRDKYNEPCNLPGIVDAIAEAMGRTPESLAAEVAANAEKFLSSLVGGGVR